MMTGDNQDVLEFLNQTKAMYDEDSTNYKMCEQAIAAVTGVEKAAKKFAYIHQCIDLYGDREDLHDEEYWMDYLLDPEWADADIGWDGYEMKPTAQPEPISEEYAKAVRSWLINYQVRCAELKGRYTPYEVLGWIVSDWGKDNGI